MTTSCLQESAKPYPIWLYIKKQQISGESDTGLAEKKLENPLYELSSSVVTLFPVLRSSPAQIGTESEARISRSGFLLITLI
jgi:hypothetical protein